MGTSGWEAVTFALWTAPVIYIQFVSEPSGEEREAETNSRGCGCGDGFIESGGEEEEVLREEEEEEERRDVHIQ